MNIKRYPVLIILAMIALGALVGCGGPTPTPIPFQLYDAEDALAAFVGAGLNVTNIRRDMTVGRGAPNTFIDRWTFEIDTVAPQGGQIVVFRNQEGMAAWQEYIHDLQSDNETRRDAIYTYYHGNLLLQLNANLLPNDARAYSEAFEAIGGG